MDVVVLLGVNQLCMCTNERGGLGVVSCARGSHLGVVGGAVLGHCLWSARVGGGGEGWEKGGVNYKREGEGKGKKTETKKNKKEGAVTGCA